MRVCAGGGGVSVITGVTVMISVEGQIPGVGPPPIGDGQALTTGSQLTGVGPPPTGDGQPLITGPQLTGVGPPPTGVGHPPIGVGPFPVTSIVIVSGLLA